MMILKANKAVLFFAQMIDQMLPAKVVFQINLKNCEWLQMVLQY